MNPSNLYALIRERNADSSRTLITTQDGRRITYGAAFNGAGAIARALTDLGVEVGDRVAVQVDKVPEAILLYLGCLQIGAVYVPLNTAYTSAELEYFLSDAQPRVFIVRPESVAVANRLCAALHIHCETLGAGPTGTFAERVSKSQPLFESVPCTPDQLAALLYTSGTTGRSKGAMLTHANLASNALTLSKLWKFTPDDVMIHALPIFHTHGLFVAFNVTLLSGSNVIFHTKFDPSTILKAFPHASVMMGVPTFYTRLLDEPGLDANAVRTMRLFVSGSAPLLAETHRAWTRRTGSAILERYGMTETNMNASNPYDGERVPGSVGVPLPDAEIRITDQESGVVLAPGETGMIEVRGPNVFKGYWRMPDKTAAEFTADGYFVTGDLGLFDANGYLRIVGRSKDLIITGGYNVYPKEIELAIDGLEGVAESAVVGVPHADFGEAVSAFVVRAKDATLGEDEVIKALKGVLASYKVPKNVIFVPELPRNAMGKVVKAELRALS